jgi:ubiquinol-cytochrome c reductase iron-sulfur subunit
MADTPNDVANPDRRNFIVLSTMAMAGIGAASAGVALVRTMTPTRDVAGAGQIEVVLDGIAEGSGIVATAGRKKYSVRRRTAAEIESAVADDNAPMRKPQPDAERVQRAEWLVLRLQCPHLGCPPQGTVAGEKRGEFGGFFCPCHNSQFDTSGRIRKGPSPDNLPVPKYEFVSDEMIKIG